MSGRKLGRESRRTSSHQNTVATSAGTFPSGRSPLPMESVFSAPYSSPCLFLSHPPSISSHLSPLLPYLCSLLWTDFLHVVENMVGNKPGIIICQCLNLSQERYLKILGKRLLSLGDIPTSWADHQGQEG